MKLMISVVVLTTVILPNLFVCESKESFKISIDEQNTKFEEKVEVDESGNTVTYHIPSHNNVDEADTLFEYTSGYMVTRVKKMKECYIEPIPQKVDSSPKEVTKNLQMYQKLNGTNAISVEVVNSVGMKERIAHPSEMNLKIQNFCSGFQTYTVKKIQLNKVARFRRDKTEEDEIVRRTGVVSNILLTTIGQGAKIPNVWAKLISDSGVAWMKVTINLCYSLLHYNPTLIKDNCNSDPTLWVFSCKVIQSNNCLYRAKCQPQFNPVRNKNEIRCLETHFFTGWLCCDVTCRPKTG